jgi:hypothetical protein
MQAAADRRRQPSLSEWTVGRHMSRMIRIPLALPITAGLLAVAFGAYLPSFALMLFGLTLFCLVPIKLGRFATAATVAASGFATLVVIELAFTILWLPDPPAIRDTGDRLRHIEASDIGRVALPGTYAVQRVLRDGETLYAVTYTIGEDGFRVTPGDGYDDALRINLLGGSFTFGQGIEDDETLAYYLGQALGVEARNFGIIGGGPHEALAILESERDTQGSINVLLTAAWHAQRIACMRPWSSGAPRFRLDRDGTLVRDGVCPEDNATPLVRALRHSGTFSVLERAYGVLHRESTADSLYALYVAVIERIAALSRDRGQALVIAYIGTASLHGIPLDNAALMQRLEAAGAIVVDVSLAPSPEKLAPDYYIHELDNHPTALANEHRAQLLAPVLESILKQQAATDDEVVKPDRSAK